MVVLDVRVYRAAFLPALIALFVVAFSLEGRPSPVRTRAIADGFDPARAFGGPRVRDSLQELGAAFPARRPGSPGDAPLPGRVGDALRTTLVLVSTSGGSGGGAGARAWARAQDAALIDGVLVLGDLAAARWRKPWVVPWSNGREQPPLGWQRTVEAAVREEVGVEPGGARATAQWSRRALPLTVGEQGEINREGVPGVLLQISGERGPAPGARVSAERFTALGRAALRTVTALDE